MKNLRHERPWKCPSPSSCFHGSECRSKIQRGLARSTSFARDVPAGSFDSQYWGRLLGCPRPLHQQPVSGVRPLKPAVPSSRPHPHGKKPRRQLPLHAFPPAHLPPGLPACLQRRPASRSRPVLHPRPEWLPRPPVFLRFFAGSCSSRGRHRFALPCTPSTQSNPGPAGPERNFASFPDAASAGTSGAGTPSSTARRIMSSATAGLV